MKVSAVLLAGGDGDLFARLDLTRFQTDYAGEAYEAVLRDCAEGAAWFGVSGLPTVILNEKLSLVGAVPSRMRKSQPSCACVMLSWKIAPNPR